MVEVEATSDAVLLPIKLLDENGIVMLEVVIMIVTVAVLPVEEGDVVSDVPELVRLFDEALVWDWMIIKAKLPELAVLFPSPP